MSPAKTAYIAKIAGQTSPMNYGAFGKTQRRSFAVGRHAPRCQSMAAPRIAHRPIHAPAVAATDDRRRAPERAAGIGLREARYCTATPRTAAVRK